MNPAEHGRWNGTDSPMHETKFCPHCREYRLVDAFARQRRGGTGRQSWCRDCINATRREAYARAKEARRDDA